MNRVNPGIRFFQCYDCGTAWESQTHDCYITYQGERCPNQLCINNCYGTLGKPYQIMEAPKVENPSLWSETFYSKNY